MNKRVFSLPPHYEQRIENELHRIGHSLTRPKKLADAVLRLSDYYTRNPLASSPWNEPWMQAASLAYYFPLNYARNQAVAREAARLSFFDDLHHVLDFGSGMGSALLAFRDHVSAREPHLEYQAFDISSTALTLGRSLSDPNAPPHQVHHFDLHAPAPKNLPEARQSLLIASYVLTELPKAPSWWDRFEALALIEPSTVEDARNLMGYRSRLIDLGYRVWAPCTHQGSCPLYAKSNRDWCHDRIHWDAPSWFLEIEERLPIKNRTLTFSYLLARKTKTPPSSLAQMARLTGDMLKEKGKTRQSVCRSEEREFVSWFPPRLKKGEQVELQRGSLISIASGLERRSVEIRLKTSEDIVEYSPDHPLS